MTKQEIVDELEKAVDVMHGNLEQHADGLGPNPIKAAAMLGRLAGLLEEDRIPTYNFLATEIQAAIQFLHGSAEHMCGVPSNPARAAVKLGVIVGQLRAELAREDAKVAI